MLINIQTKWFRLMIVTGNDARTTTEPLLVDLTGGDFTPVSDEEAADEQARLTFGFGRTHS